mmetsp:Transcript_34872/g.39530  ORF Transcript_34872/g.39530 Transcript_34872/m.39530 type:complete len:193 (+) Transcript_34872:40-618(+)
MDDDEERTEILPRKEKKRKIDDPDYRPSCWTTFIPVVIYLLFVFLVATIVSDLENYKDSQCDDPLKRWLKGVLVSCSLHLVLETIRALHYCFAQANPPKWLNNTTRLLTWLNLLFFVIWTVLGHMWYFDETECGKGENIYQLARTLLITIDVFFGFLFTFLIIVGLYSLWHPGPNRGPRKRGQPKQKTYETF